MHLGIAPQLEGVAPQLPNKWGAVSHLRKKFTIPELVLYNNVFLYDLRFQNQETAVLCYPGEETNKSSSIWCDVDNPMRARSRVSFYVSCFLNQLFVGEDMEFVTPIVFHVFVFCSGQKNQIVSLSIDHFQKWFF